MRSITCIAAALTLSSGMAFGQMTFDSQHRSIVAQTSGGTFQSSAPNFAPFSNTVASSAGPTTSSASINSTLAAGRITLSGSTHTNTAPFQSAFAQSLSDVTFTVADAVAFTAHVSLSGPGQIQLTGPGLSRTLASGVQDWSGILTPGQYHLASVSTCSGQSNSAYALDLSTSPASSFTYQGQLLRAGAPVDGPAHLRFSLFDSAHDGSQLGSQVDQPAVPVNHGIFTTRLDYGSDAFAASQTRWLEISVVDNDLVTVLAPRQPVDHTPLAQTATNALNAATAQNATTATTASIVPWAGVTGVPSNVRDAFSPWLPYPGTSNIYYPGGFCAIGNAAPLMPLTVGGTGNSNEWMAFVDSRPLYPTYRQPLWHINGGGVTGQDLNFVETGVADYRLVLAQGGQVGINGQPGLIPNNNAQFSVNADYFHRGVHIECLDPLKLGLSFHTDGSPSLAGMYQDPNGQLRFTSNFRGAPTTWTSLGTNGAWTVQSDRRLKHDIAPIGGLLSKIAALEPVSYFYNNQDLTLRPDRNIGFIAQDVESVFPEFVSGRGDELRSIDYAGMSVVAIGAVKELSQQVADDRETIARMSQQLKALEARLQKLGPTPAR